MEWGTQTMNESYYDSANGETITFKRAIQELKNHGIDDFTDFYIECGVYSKYDATTVLDWLGY